MSRMNQDVKAAFDELQAAIGHAFKLANWLVKTYGHEVAGADMQGIRLDMLCAFAYIDVAIEAEERTKRHEREDKEHE